MPIFDVLSPKENSALSEILQKAHAVIGQDLEVLLSQPVTLSRSSIDYNTPTVIKNNFKNVFIHIKSQWTGAVDGTSSILICMPDAKAMCGFLMMEQVTAIRETMEQPLTEEDVETFREIANQVNGSFDNGLRQSLKFDFHTAFGGIEILDFTDDALNMAQSFSSEGYVYCRSMYKLSEFNETFFLQMFPIELIRNINALQFKEIEQEEQQREQGNLRTILIVDSDEVSRKIVKNHMKDTSYVMLDAGNGMDALGLLRKRKVDVVVMEIDMPSMNGIQVCHRMKSNPNTRKTPIIFCSANSTRDTVTNAIRGGGTDFLVKPVGKELLIERIERIFSKVKV